MILPLLIASTIIVSLFSAFIAHKYLRTKMEMQIFSREFDLLKSETNILQNEKIEYIKKIEQLLAKVEYQNQHIADFDKLKKDSESSSRAVLFNLGNELSKQLIDLHKQENQEARALSEKNIKVTSEKFNSEFERLIHMIGSLNQDIKQSKDVVDLIKNSLLSPSGAGKLAEITLENILKASGLRDRLDFVMQYHILTEEKAMMRPDAVIFLPSNNVMVIDAKASKFLVDYNEEDSQNLAKTMNIHLRSLSGKEYAQQLTDNIQKKGSKISNIITLMFLPTEHAIEKLIEADSNFMTKAWALNIFPVGPSGLMNMLSFAKFQISERMMLENHQQIIEEVKKLMTSVSSLTEHAARMGNGISSLVNYYDKFAASFNVNFLSRARNIKKLGINSAGKKQEQEASLARYQIVSTKSEMIEVRPEEPEVAMKSLEEV